MAFINRQRELTTLKQQYNSKESSLVILYGRRRVGKTALATEFMRQQGGGIYFLATEESETINLQMFRNQAAEFIGSPLLAASQADWEMTFRELVSHQTNQKKIIVIDEFQYIGNSNPAFPSIMQKIWDTVLKDANIMLVLCGSMIVSMKKQTLDYDSPLYGRRTAQIRLRQIPFEHYGEFFPGFDEDQLTELYAVTGGVPKYIQNFIGSEDIFEKIEKNILNPSSYLYEEPYFLLHSEVKEVGSYFSILRAIAMKNHKLSEISSFLGTKQSNLTNYLKVLEGLDIIEREIPATELNPEKSKSGLYRIRDNYLEFWFHFVYPYCAFLEKGETDYVMGKIREGFIQNHTSYVYEDICRGKVSELSDRLPFQSARVGRFWGSATGETDIVGFTPGEKELLIGECKYSNSEKGLKVLHDLQEKTSALMKLTGTSDVYYVIFGRSGYSKGLLDEAEDNDHIILV